MPKGPPKRWDSDRNTRLPQGVEREHFTAKWERKERFRSLKAAERAAADVTRRGGAYQRAYVCHWQDCCGYHFGKESQGAR